MNMIEEREVRDKSTENVSCIIRPLFPSADNDDGSSGKTHPSFALFAIRENNSFSRPGLCSLWISMQSERQRPLEMMTEEAH